MVPPRPPNKRLKLSAHLGVFDFSPARCSLSAIRQAAPTHVSPHSVWYCHPHRRCCCPRSRRIHACPNRSSPHPLASCRRRGAWAIQLQLDDDRGRSTPAHLLVRAGVDPSLLPPSRDPNLGRGEESLVVRLGYPSDPARLALQRWGEGSRSTRAAGWPAASGGHGRTRAPVRSH